MSHQTIYFDEAGFTGSNLLDTSQPSFVYASVAVDPATASDIVQRMTERFNLRGRERKGSNLVKYSEGQEAISWLLSECKGISNIAVANKKLALAGKFFEYIFEPVLSPINSIFYAIEFHLFIANLLYIHLEAKDGHAEVIMNEFGKLMRNQDPVCFQKLLTPLDQDIKLNEPIGQMLTFALCHQKRIIEEIKHLSGIDGLHNWVLELTTTFIFWLLSFWGEKFDSLEVYCDKSKPLEVNRALFEALVGRKDRIYMKLGNKRDVLLTYNLTKPIELVDSREFPGIQIADILASSIAYALKSPEDSISQKWLKLGEGIICDFNILPEPRKIDLTERLPFINMMILGELVDRTIKTEKLLIDWPEFIRDGSYIFDRWKLEQGKI